VVVVIAAAVVVIATPLVRSMTVVTMTVAPMTTLLRADPRNPASRRKRCMNSVLVSELVWRMEWYSLFKRSCSARGKN
nr:hypothetical protein [Tanacetum cinerariifolium]